MTFLLCFSLLLQLVAAALALRLGREAAWARGWLFVAAALLLMAARRAVTLANVLGGDVRPDPSAEVVAIGISILMLLGVTFLGPLLRSARNAEGVVPQLLESAPDAMIAADENDRVAHVNGAAVRLLGYARGELMGMEVGVMMPERFRQRHREAFRRYFGSPRSRIFPADADLHVRRKDGTEVPVEISIAPLETGSRKLVVAAIRDVSERRRAEAAIRESEGRYRSLIDDVLDNSSVGVCIVGPDRKVVWVNRAFTAFFGLDAKRTAGADAPELAARLAGLVEDPEGFRERLVAAYAENTRAEGFECRVLAGDGRWERWLEHRSQPIASGLYAGGRIDQYADITERKLAEQRIRQFVHIARNMQLGLLVYRLDDREDDRSLRLVIVNPAAERLLGIAKDDLLGRRIDEVFPALRAKGIPALFADVIRTGSTREAADFEYGDGRVLSNVWAFKAFPLPDESVGVVFESVTALRRSEELVSNIAAGVADARGDDFFRSLVLYLARSLGVEYALVGALDRPGEVACVAFCDHEQVRSDMRYSLDGTPCEHVTAGRVCSYPAGVRERFPQDRMLVDIGAECYLGAPLLDASGRPLGLIAVIGKRPLADPATAESVLRIFAARAAAELERRRDRGVPTAS
jgi:PAS domain S-box-containing protein